jgi:hypothetical protein
MIFGDPTKIAVTYEVLFRQENSHFAFGTFNIFVDDKLLLSGGSNWTIDCLVGYFKKTKALSVGDTLHLSKEYVFKNACTSRGYLVHDSRELDSDIWGSDDPAAVEAVNLYLKEIENMRTDPPFGTELPLYSELIDKGLRMFFFASENLDRIVYSFDSGKTVIENRVPQGTVNALVNALPECV